MFLFEVNPNFIKDLQRLDPEIQTITWHKIKFYSLQDNPLKFSKKLLGTKNCYRFRIGKYRAVFSLEKNIITLLALNHRKDIYQNL